VGFPFCFNLIFPVRRHRFGIHVLEVCRISPFPLLANTLLITRAPSSPSERRDVPFFVYRMVKAFPVRPLDPSASVPSPDLTPLSRILLDEFLVDRQRSLSRLSLDRIFHCLVFFVHWFFDGPLGFSCVRESSFYRHCNCTHEPFFLSACKLLRSLRPKC